MPERLEDAHIKDFLENAPLYSPRVYAKPRINRSSLLITSVDVLCSVCNTERRFRDPRPRGSGAGHGLRAIETGITNYLFRCASCLSEHKYYLVHQTVSDELITLEKFGEWPRLPLQRDQSLQKFFSDDLALYEKAVVCRQNGYGIGAFAYFRRLLENNIQRIIDLIREEADPDDDELLGDLDELYRSPTMKEQTEVASRALPKHLRPGGVNPLARLYSSLSEGLHSKTEEECLGLAATIEGCLTYLIGELSDRRRHRTRFSQNIQEL